MGNPNATERFLSSISVLRSGRDKLFQSTGKNYFTKVIEAVDKLLLDSYFERSEGEVES